MNMGVFPSGQWGQTVNLLLSASVVRIHPRPPRTPVSEPGTGVSVLSAVQKGRKGGFEQQQRRPLPAAETGRSCWGCGQQDARAAQGTMQPLGAATRAPFLRGSRNPPAPTKKTSAYASTLRFLFSPAFPSPAKNTCISGTPCYDTNQKKSYKVIRRY